MGGTSSRNHFNKIRLIRLTALTAFWDKKDGLVGEFKFFSEFGWAETGATDWKQTKAGNRSHQPNLFQTDSSRFSSHFKKEKTTRVPKNPNRLYSLFLNLPAQ
jgi:hypothetical protein